MTESMIVYLLASAALRWAARHFNLIALKAKPSDIPPLPTGIGHGQVALWLTKTVLQLAKELVAVQAGQPPAQTK